MKPFSFLKKKAALPVKAEVGLVTATIAVFVAITIATIGSSSIWFDEAFGAYLIRFDYLSGFLFTAMDVHPPLYYWVLKTWGMLFGTSDVALRSMSVFFGAIALIIAYFLVRRMFGVRAAMIALPFVAVLPIFVRYAQEARMYTMVLAIGLAGTYVFYRLMQRPSRRLWIIYAILLAIGMWTHYFMALVWLAHWVWRAINSYQKPVSRWMRAFFSREWVGAHALAVLLFAPWLPWMVRQVVDVQTNGFWIPPISPTTVPSYFSDVFLYKTTDEMTPWLTVLLAALVSVAAYVLYRTWRQTKGSERKGFSLLLVGAFAPGAILIAMSLPPLESTFMDRYMLVSAVLLVLALGVAIAKGPETLKRARIILVALLIVSSVIGISSVYAHGNYNQFTQQKSQTKQLVDLIRSTPGSVGQPIIANTPWIYYEAAQYSTTDHQVYFIDKYVEYKYGSLEMLRKSDMGKIKDLDAFLEQNPIIWYIGRPGDVDIDPPAGNVEVVQSIRIDDPVTKKAAYQAVQYRVIAE